METIKKQSLFWDVNLKELDKKDHQDFIIQRILERGNVEDLRWASAFYGEDSLKEIFLKKNDKLDLKSRNFWSFYFNVDKEKCTHNQSIKKPSWFLRK